MTSRLMICACLLTAGCAARSPEIVQAAPLAVDWKRVATASDMNRLRKWRTAFVEALDQARAAGKGGEIAREGALLQPDAGIEGPGLPDGNYRCRVVKVGGQGAAMLPFIAYPAFDCRVSDEGEVASFVKTTGSQRPVGLIFDNDNAKSIFLGTLMLGDETAALDYGRDAERDMAGAVERIGPKRWRIVLPYPRFESKLDVIELVPA